MSDTITDEELAEWEQDDPYNSILQRKRMPRLIAALRAERADVERLTAENAELDWALADRRLRP